MRRRMSEPRRRSLPANSGGAYGHGGASPLAGYGAAPLFPLPLWGKEFFDEGDFGGVALDLDLAGEKGRHGIYGFEIEPGRRFRGQGDCYIRLAYRWARGQGQAPLGG